MKASPKDVDDGNGFSQFLMVVWQKMVNFNGRLFEKGKKCINIAYINDETYNQNFQHKFRHCHINTLIHKLVSLLNVKKAS